MKTADLLLSGLSITEDEYDYKGVFYLGYNEKSIKVDLADLQNSTGINEIKNTFGLEESEEEIRAFLMDVILEKAAISSRISEGENYEVKSRRKKLEKTIGSFDLA